MANWASRDVDAKEAGMDPRVASLSADTIEAKVVLWFAVGGCWCPFA